MDANLRAYSSYAGEAAKLATAYLKTHGVEQREIAKELKISFPYLARMLCGERPMLHRHAVALLRLVMKETAQHPCLTFQQLGLLVDTAAAWCNAIAAWHKATLGPETDDFLTWLETLPEDQQRMTGMNYRNRRDKEVAEATREAAKLKVPWLKLWLSLCPQLTGALRRECEQVHA